MNGQILPLALLSLAITALPAFAQSAQSTGETTLQTNVNLVLVDVVVVDHGKHIHGLDKSAFHIFEDGKEQRVYSFDEHKPDANPAPLPAPPALQPHIVSNAPTYPASDTINVLLLDALNTPTANQSDLHRQLLAYLEQLPPGKTIAIFTLTTRLRQLQGFTNDPSALKRALNEAKGGPQTIPELKSSDPKDISKDSLNQTDLVKKFSAEFASAQVDQRVQITIEAMKQIARYLSLLPGRKNLIWFSGSFPMAITPNWEINNAFAAVRNYSEDVREASHLLASARVAVYPVYIKGLISPSKFNVTDSSQTISLSASNPLQSSQSSSISAATDTSQMQILSEHASMQDLAEQSGGVAFVHSNDLMAAFNAALENGESYYTIGYIPANKDMKGNFHKVKVTLDGSQYTLTYRHGYYADTPSKSNASNAGLSSTLLAATLLGAPQLSQLQFIARALPSTDPTFQSAPIQQTPAGDLASSLKPPISHYVFDMKVDPHKLTFSEPQPGTHHADLEFVVVAYDADGKRVNYIDRGMNLNTNAERFSSIQQNGVLARLILDLPNGYLTLRIVVQDKASGLLGAIELPLSIEAK